VNKDELQNTIGNLLRRSVTLSVKNFESRRPVGNGDLKEAIEKAWKGYHEGFTSFDVRGALESMIVLAREGNLYVDQQKPWELAKTDLARLEVVLGNLMDLCKALGEMLQPVIPEGAQKILDQVGGEMIVLGDALFPRKEE
jgi:methionyl-tRNA synthetase